MSPDLDSHLLRSFVIVTETGSVSEAAVRLHRTQAAVSMALRRLEEDTGHQLLERSSRGVKPTPAGRTLLRYAYRILSAGTEARAALNAVKAAETVRVGMPEEIAAGYLLSTLRQFSVCHPGVALDIVIDSSRALWQRFSQGTTDIIIGDPSLIHASPVFRWQHRLCWAAGTGTENFFSRRPVPLVIYSGECAWQEQLYSLLLSAGIEWKVVCSSTSLSAILSAAEAGLGLAVLPVFNTASGNIHVISPDVVGFPGLPQAEFGLYATAMVQEGRISGASLLDFLLQGLQAGTG